MELERDRRWRRSNGGRRDCVPAQAAQQRYGERRAEERKPDRARRQDLRHAQRRRDHRDERRQVGPQPQLAAGARSEIRAAQEDRPACGRQREGEQQGRPAQRRLRARAGAQLGEQGVPSEHSERKRQPAHHQLPGTCSRISCW